MAAIDLLVGPILIGTLLNVWLYGLMLFQTHTYFQTSKRDPTWIKMMVAFLLLADTVNSVFDCIFAYDYAVKKFGDYESILTATWVFNTDPVMTVIISSTVQAFFGWRVRRLTGRTWLAVAITISAFLQFLCGLATSIACGIVKRFVEFRKFQAVVIIWLVLAPITDSAITAALVWFLRSHRTGFAATDDLVSKITRLTIQTGAITAVVAAIDLAMFCAFPNNLHLIFNLPLAKLYGNCLMSSLNARREWSESSYPSGKEARGISVTTTTNVHRDAYELGLSANGRTLPDDVNPQVITIGQTQNGTVAKRPIDDGLSLHSDSVDDEYASSEKATASESHLPHHVEMDSERKVDVEWSAGV